MPRRLFWLTCLLLLAAAPAFAAEGGQEDEPSPFNHPWAEKGHHGVDLGIYLTAGKALRYYDLTRLNHTLAAGGAEPFVGFVDDWNFELVVTATQAGYFALAGGFWDQATGGSPVDAEISGYEILVRWGGAVARNRLVQLFPTFGIGYASRTLSLDGDLAALDVGDLPRHGSVDLDRGGMALEAALRVDTFGAWPDKSPAAFISVESLTIGWQGVPIVSDWQRGDKTVHGVPNDLSHALFVRFNIGFGAGFRERKKDEN